MRMLRGVRGFMPFVGPLLGLALAAIGFYLVGAARNRSLAESYLLWNLFLAWVPLLIALGLIRMLRHRAWSSWQGIALTIIWLAFLPNSFYMVSDYIHLQDVGRVDVLYDAVMFTLFILDGLLVGYASVYLLHVALRDRLPRRQAAGWVAVVLLLCSFAIYLGRDLRWNTWDIVLNPIGVVFDVSDRLIDPAAHPQAFTTTVTFFAFLGVVYLVGWKLVRTLLAIRPRR